MKLIPPIPFCVCIDTREQKELKFPDGTPTIVGSCYPGDYTLVGYRTDIVVERKGVTCNHGVWTSDLVSTITELLRGQSGDFEKGSLRFRWELDAMRKIIRSGGVAFVATDRPMSWYEAHNYFGGLHPSALLRTIDSLEAEFGVPFKFYESTEQMTVRSLGVSLEVWKHANGLQSFKMQEDAKPSAPYAKWEREVWSKKI